MARWRRLHVCIRSTERKSTFDSNSLLFLTESHLFSVTAYISFALSSALCVRIFASPRWQRPPSDTWAQRALVIEGGIIIACCSCHSSLSLGLTAATTPSHCITFTHRPPADTSIHQVSSIIHPSVSSAPAMSTVPASQLSRFEEQHRNLAKVEIDEMLGLVGNVAAKVAANNAVPRRVVLLVKLLLDISGNVLWGGAYM